jgi:hypothetical protein
MASVKTKYQCLKCNNLFSAKGGNYKKHIQVCDGSFEPFVKLFSCKHCSITFESLSNSERANHSRWCKQNPKREEYVNKLKGVAGLRSGIDRVALMREARQKSGKTNQYTKAKIEGSNVPVNPRKGLTGFKGTPHTEETREILRQKALASKHRRLVRSVRSYTKKDGTVVQLDSSWEEILAKRLDEICVEWVRPEEPIPYVAADGRTHNYFPDFFLPRYNLYLDPKNPAAINAQRDKIDSLKKMMDNLIIIETREECANFQIVSGRP